MNVRWLVVPLLVGGCALDEVGLLTDAGGPDAPADVTVDVVSPEGGIDASEAGQDAADAAPDAPDADCLNDPSGHYFCAGSPTQCHAGTDCAACGSDDLYCVESGFCVSDCNTCDFFAVECFTCPNGTPQGTCIVPDGGAGDCTAQVLSPSCDCTKGLVTCPAAPTQVCVHSGPSHTCETCGAPGTDGDDCVGGGRCNETLASCF